MNSKSLAIIAVAFVAIAAVLVVSWHQDSADEGPLPSEEAAALLTEGDYAGVYALMSDNVKSVYTEEQFAATLSVQMEALVASYGSVTSLGGSYSAGDVMGYHVSYTPVYLYLDATRVAAVSSDDGIEALYFVEQDMPSDDPLPDGLVETDVSVVTGDLTPLPGKITSLKGSDSRVAVVLVQGSGSSGMNESVGTNHIFQQLAWGLAEQGIDVLRYDKRTYVDAVQTIAMGNSLNIGYETVDDAVSAVAMMKGMGYDSVYVIGHSLGGMMAPVIAERCGDMCDGFVSLAGSPLDLAEISYHQNLAVIAKMPDGPEKDQALQFVESQMDLYSIIGGMSESQLLSTTVFGMSAYYLKSIADCDAVGIAQGYGGLMAFLQGDADWQVTPEDGIDAWIDALGQKEGVVYREYPGMNHLLAVPPVSTGDVSEYYQPLTVSYDLIFEIAETLGER